MSICDNIKEIQQRITDAAKKCGRNPSDIKLIAVTKTKPIEDLKEAFKCGMTEFGENRPQELAAKYPEFADTDVNWHLIGQLQKNKVKYIIDKAQLIHSVDSYELALEINKRAKAIGKVQDILIQINISGEESKSGVSPDEAEALCRKISELENIKIKGLMTISVRGLDYQGNKEIFSRLAMLSKKLMGCNIPNAEFSELSMGMTNDFEAAIEAGSTMIRVGTAIFGARDYMI